MPYLVGLQAECLPLLGGTPLEEVAMFDLDCLGSCTPPLGSPTDDYFHLPFARELEDVFEVRLGGCVVGGLAGWLGAGWRESWLPPPAAEQDAAAAAPVEETSRGSGAGDLTLPCLLPRPARWCASISRAPPSLTPRPSAPSSCRYVRPAEPCGRTGDCRHPCMCSQPPCPPWRVPDQAPPLAAPRPPQDFFLRLVGSYRSFVRRDEEVTPAALALGIDRPWGQQGVGAGSGGAGGSGSGASRASSTNGRDASEEENPR